MLNTPRMATPFQKQTATLRLTNTKPQFKCGYFLGCLFIWLVTKRNPRSAHTTHTEPETHTKALPTSN
jgi:hypothetical protein